MLVDEIELIPVGTKKLWQVFYRILQLYEYEFSNITQLQLDENGLFINTELDENIKKNKCICFLLRYQQTWAGLVVINLKSYLNDDENIKDIAEFFVMKAYRKRRLGYSMAKKIFSMFPGKWEVRQLPKAVEARSFWLRVFAQYKPEFYTDRFIVHPRWEGFIQTFTSHRNNNSNRNNTHRNKK